MASEKIIFGAGCFWGVEATFRGLQGVTNVTCGYAGGHTRHPTYREVCSDETGHAEVVLVEYDPSLISFESLLDTFWGCHNPTTLNRQGADSGSQYRSVIFFNTPQQEISAKRSRERLQQSGQWQDPIVTEIVPAPVFYSAEEYHQRYFDKHGIH